MDEKASELSKTGLVLARKEMSPEYQLVQARLLGYLAAHNSTVEQLAIREQSARANRQLLSEFAQLLPKAELADGQWSLCLDDPYTLRIIQSVMLWSDEISGKECKSYDEGKTYNTYARYARRPYIIIGKKGENYNELLLACIGENGVNETPLEGEAEEEYFDEDGELIEIPKKYGELYTFKPGWKDKKRIRAMERIIGSEYPTPEEMATMFNEDRRLLVVTPGSPGSTKLKRKVDRWNYNHMLKRVFDEQLGEFDVVSHLNRIAVGLGLEDQLADLISMHTVSGEA